MTHVMLRRAVAVAAALVMLVTVALPAAAVDGDAYVSLANQKRASVGRAPVSLYGLADQISVERANQMAAADVLAHDFAYVKARLDASGVCYRGYAEIIASERGHATYDPARTMEQWWASPTHHDIIIGDYNAASGSHTTSVTGTTYSVMIFVKLCDAPTTSNTTITRLWGNDRYATAAALSKSRFASAATVFVATGASFPDALAGAPSAARHNGPILLTARDSLPAATANELARLRPSTIVVLGGTGAVSDAVAHQLAAYARVVRWSGANRFATAAAISANTFSPGVATAFVATGSSFPDALSGGGVAGRDGGPILLVTRDSVPGATANELARLRPGRIVILGGAGPVSDAVANALKPYATSGSVTRLAGSDRYATSVQISRAAYASTSHAAFVATGTNFPDGLAGGPVAALVPGPLLLVAPNSLPASVATELQRLAPKQVYVIGGGGAVSDSVVHAIDAVLP